MRKFAFLLFAVFVSASLFAQYKISGTVSSETGEKLNKVIISIPNQNIAVSTDENGFYQIENLKAGKYSLEVSYIGYSSQVETVDLSSNKTLSFTLEVDYSLEIDKIVVKATRAGDKTPVAYTNISEEEIKKNNLGQDIPYILKMTPSLVSSSDAGTGVGYSQFFIRGTDVSRINVTLNGVPLNDSESHGVWWVNVPDFASSVNNIQVQRGVGTSTNGAAAFGASVNLMTTGMNKKAYAEISNSYGSFNTWKNTVKVGSGLLNNHFTFDARLSKISSDGYIDRAWSDLKSYYVTGAYHGNTTLLRAVVFSGLEKTYQAWYGVPLDSLETNRTYNPYTYENEIDHYQQTHFQLILAQKILKGLTFNTTLHYTIGGGYYEQFRWGDDLSDYQLDPIVVVNDTIFSSDLIRRKWLDNDFYGATYSLNYSNKKLDATLGGAWNKYDGRHFGDIIWMQYAGETPKNQEWYRNTGTKTDMNVFAKINYEVVKKINLFADVQYRQVNYKIKGIDDDLRDISQTHSFPFFNPKAGLMFDISENQQTYFSFAVANREPKRSDFTDAEQNQTPTSETLYDYELGYKLNTEKMLVNANFYYMDYKNQLIMNGEINDVGSAIMVNVPESYRTGVELVAGVNLFDRVDWQANFTYSQNIIRNFTEYIDNWDYWYDMENEPYQITENVGDVEIPFSPSMIASNLISVKIFKPLSIDFITKYVSEQKIYAGKTHIYWGETRKDYLDAYLVNDLKINLNFRTKYIKEINFNFQVNNIFNEEYETFAWAYRYHSGGEFGIMDGYLPQAGTNFLGGLSFKF